MYNINNIWQKYLQDQISYIGSDHDTVYSHLLTEQTWYLSV